MLLCLDSLSLLAETRKIEKTWKMSRFRRGSSSLLLISKQSADKTKSDLTLKCILRTPTDIIKFSFAMLTKQCIICLFKWVFDIEALKSDFEAFNTLFDH